MALPTPPTDAGLVRAAQKGDKRAFVEIVTRYQGMVCGIALSILGDFAASEDAGQDTFLRAWRKLHQLHEPHGLRPWLAQIARNAALAQLRGKRFHDSIEDRQEITGADPGPDEITARRMMLRWSDCPLPSSPKSIVSH